MIGMSGIEHPPHLYLPCVINIQGLIQEIFSGLPYPLLYFGKSCDFPRPPHLFQSHH